MTQEVTCLTGPASLAGPLENVQRAHTWFVRVKARLVLAKFWKDMLDSQKTVKMNALALLLSLFLHPLTSTDRIQGPP